MPFTKIIIIVAYILFFGKMASCGTNYLDITGVLLCEQIPYPGATVWAVDKGKA